MLHMPRALVLHKILLSVLEHFVAKRGDMRLISELGDRREESFEVKDDSCTEREAAQCLPIDSEMTAREGEGGGLGEAVGFVRISGWHEKRGVHFETPRSTLNRPRGGQFREISTKEWSLALKDGMGEQ